MLAPSHSLLLSLALAAGAASVAAAPTSSPRGTLSDATLALIKSNLASNDGDTWVSGTETQALLELDYPELSVFSPSFLKSTLVPSATNAIIDKWYAKRPSDAQQMAIVSGGAAGDPASLGVAWILAAKTESKSAYDQVIKEELNYLLNTVARTSDGAISMRPTDEPVQLWADYMYMVPPFLAAYGAFNSDTSVLSQAYTQCKLYRNYLQDPSTKLWKHIVMGDWGDVGLWGTGNAWAAAGMTRVAATMLNSPYASSYASEIEDLRAWTNEILVAAFSRLQSGNLLPNYYDKSSTFLDSSSSALLAATSLRLATLGLKQTSTNLAIASAIRLAVNDKVDTSSGWLQDVVDPLSWEDEVNKSPEGQAFVLLLHAAWADYIAL
ncbi:Six-hairpin glycosidase-like protein [Leucosporidium creatinivorum]|uniref:Six-hairpin glycosidase-like protein n=1 Tax=Leucosporidium creatinivorum TaxID=106004 RepID=A0A1Y2CJ88_9BASI|nr:Six-hairpin glycosidase-like protein [Leucosporidium creatinivorum]